MPHDLFSFKPASEVKSIFDEKIAEIEEYLEICRICDKSRKDCPSCFIWQELNKCYRRADPSSFHDNSVTDFEKRGGDVSESESKRYQKFFAKIVKNSIEGLSKFQDIDASYINPSPEIVKKDSWREVLKLDSKKRRKISRKRIKNFERSPKRFLTISRESGAKHIQRKVTVYDLVDGFDEIDCRIVMLMSEDYHQAEIARILGKSRQVVSYRVKKILRTGLVKVLKLGKFIHYKPSADLLNLIHSKLNEIRNKNKNKVNKGLGRVEKSEPNLFNQKQAEKLSDVHHITATVKVFVDAKALRLKCQNCPKFSEIKKCRTKCSCKGARYVRMKNWDFHAVRYKGYEISAHNGKSLTVSVKGIRVLVDWRSSQKPSEQVYYKAKDVVRDILEAYFDRFFSQTGINVRIDWSSFRIRGTHLVLEENEELVKSIQKECNSQTVALKGEMADTFVDESYDKVSHSHVEAYVKNLAALDYYHDLLNGRIHEKLSKLEASLAIQESAHVCGGNARVTDLVRKLGHKLEEMHKKLEYYAEQTKLLTSLKNELSDVKSLLSDIKTALLVMS